MENERIDILDFVSMENKNFMISLANSSEEMQFLGYIQGLYNAALTCKDVEDNSTIVFQLLVFTHYHFLNSTAAFMRCHLSEAFSSVRIAVDAALIAVHIIKDRASQKDYLDGKKPFKNLVQYYRGLIADKKELPHPFIPHLIKLHSQCSQFASHADIGSFFHRVEVEKSTKKTILSVKYFQVSKDKNEKKFHFLSILHHFVMVLDVFSDFLVKEQKIVKEDWHRALRELGSSIHEKAEIAKRQVPLYVKE